jgi:hypothetical protein
MLRCISPNELTELARECRLHYEASEIGLAAVPEAVLDILEGLDTAGRRGSVFSLGL